MWIAIAALMVLDGTVTLLQKDRGLAMNLLSVAQIVAGAVFLTMTLL